MPILMDSFEYKGNHAQRNDRPGLAFVFLVLCCVALVLTAYIMEPCETTATETVPK